MFFKVILKVGSKVLIKNINILFINAEIFLKELIDSKDRMDLQGKSIIPIFRIIKILDKFKCTSVTCSLFLIFLAYFSADAQSHLKHKAFSWNSYFHFPSFLSSFSKYVVKNNPIITAGRNGHLR